jgi:hypothetical protein
MEIILLFGEDGVTFREHFLRFAGLPLEPGVSVGVLRRKRDGGLERARGLECIDNLCRLQYIKI